jgi:hypothetical protein
MDRTSSLLSDERTASNIMIIPSAAVMDHLLQHRQRTLQFPVKRTDPTTHGGIRVRIGHLLIAAGTSLSGDVAERHAARPHLARTA